MDKNKSRTDLLAAGRKKLQQFRQKKDGKGSKSSGKASRPDNDVVADEASSVAKPAKGKKQLPVGEGPVQVSTDNSVATYADLGTPDISSTSNLPIEVDGVGEDGSNLRLINDYYVDASVPDVDLQTSNLDNGTRTVSSSETVNIEGKTEGGHMPVRPVGLKAVLDYANALKAGELKSAYGEDQEDDYSVLEPDTRSSSKDLEGDVNHALSGSDERTQLNSEDVQEDAKMEGDVNHALSGSDERTQLNSEDVQEDAKMEPPSIATEETSEHDEFPAFSGESNDPNTTKADVRSVFPHSVALPDRPTALAAEPKTEPQEDIVVGVHGGGESTKLLPVSGDSESGGLESQMVASGEVTPVSLPQLAKVLQLLGEDEFRFLVKERESVTTGHLKNDPEPSLSESGTFEFSERLKEQLYMANLEREMNYMQLCEQMDVQKDFDNHRLQWAAVSASLNEAQGKNTYLSDELARCMSQLSLVTCEREELQKHISSSETELSRFSARIDELQIELDKSQHQLSNVSAELVDLQVTNDDLNACIASLTEEKNKLEKEKVDGALENEKLAKELMECNASLELSRAGNANYRESLAVVTEERAKLEEQEQLYVRENNKLLAELAEWKLSVEALKQENSNLHGILTSEEEDRGKLESAKEQFLQQNDKLSSELLECQRLVETQRADIANIEGILDLVTNERNKLREEMDHLKVEKEEHMTELTNCRNLMEALQVEYEKAMVDLKDGALRLELLTEENATLSSTLNLYKAKIRELDDCTMKSQQSTSDESVLVKDNSHQALEKGERAISHHTSIDEQLNWDVFEDSSGFVALKKHLSEVDKVMQKLDEAIEGMHSLSTSLSRSGGKAATPGVSKLIQAFESKSHTDDELEETTLGEVSSTYKLAREQVANLKDLSKDLVLDVENASQLFMGERSAKKLSETKLRELIVQLEAFKEQSNHLEETFVEHVVLDEALKQYVCTVEAKKGELLVLCEDSRQEEIVTKAKNCELAGKLCNLESRICEMQVQIDKLRQRSDDMASLNHLLESLHAKLDASIGTMPFTLTSETGNTQDIGARVATSVDAAIAVIQDMRGKLEEAHRDNGLLSSSYEDMSKKTKDLEGKCEQAADLLHKIYDSLQKLLDDSHPSIEESRNNIKSEKLLDPLVISSYDILIEELRKLIGERGQLESMNRERISELLEREKDIEELNRRCINSDLVAKLLGDIQSVVELVDIEIKPAEPVASLDCMIHFLIERYRSAKEQVGLFIEKLNTKEMKLIELQGQIDHLSFSIIPYENESHVFKESLRSAMEQLAAIQSEKQLKETELQQSEQRVSSLREKLHIAVTKGKGLISQRDSLKQSLTATTAELEKCLHELQLKDAALQETETKLKNYSEAGERMEALESELSYIRNSATALRESFLLKDSVLQRIEEILEDLELPEHFHSGDIIEKVDWLARSVAGTSVPVSSWDQKNSTGAGSYSDSGFGNMESWKEDLQQATVPGDELRRNYEELQSKFYGLAEHNEMLEQSLMERNNLVKRWEEILDQINMPQQLRSLDPGDKIEWLQGALLEANDRSDSLQKNIYNLENACESLTANLEDLQRRFADLEATLQSVINERENLSSSLEVLRHDYDKVSEKAASYEIENDKLQNEVGVLQSKLDEKRVDEEHMDHVHGELRRLQDLIMDVLQDPQTEDLSSSTSDILRLEGLLRKLVDSYRDHSLGQNIVGEVVEEHITEESSSNHGESRTRDSGNHEDLAVLGRKLEEAEGNLMRVKEERDKQVEKNQSLLHEVEALEVKNQELQKLLLEEEQKCASVKEKLNVAVRKGKSLLQQRDTMRQSISEMTSEVERLNSEIKHQENLLLEGEQKIKDLSTSQERMANMESEIKLLRNHLAEADSELLDKRHTLSTMLVALAEIDLGVELGTSDPVEKLKQIEKVWHDLNAAMSSFEQDSRKSKRAAELLLAELNEVQERNEELQDELSKATMELSEISKERDSAEAAKRESLSHLEHLSALHSEGRSSQISGLMVLKSGLDQLSPGLTEINNLLNDVLPKSLELVYNLEASMKSSLESGDSSNVGGQTLGGAPSGIGSQSENKANFLHSESFLDKMGEQFGDSNIVDLWRSVGGDLQDLITKICTFEKQLRSHSKSLHDEVVLLSETVGTLHRELSSNKYSLESAKEEIAQLKSTGKQKETENLMLRGYVTMLYKACKSSVLEIENYKRQLVGNAAVAGDLRYEVKSSISSDGGDIFGGQNLSTSEEYITSMVNRLSSLVKDFHSSQAENVEVSQKEMKATISSLQKELREKDIEKDRICVELVSQIKQAEAAAMRNLEELEPAKAHIRHLQEQLVEINEQRNMLEQRVKELQGRETIMVDLQERVQTLTDALTAKEQEAEALLQALDEEEAQMENLTNKITDLEKLVQQKDLDLESVEASRGKALKKLSVTVSKFDELHHLSATLLSEVEKLQSQVQERDSEISFLRDEITRCTSDSLLASKSNERSLDEIRDILTWLDSVIPGAQRNDMHLDGEKVNQVHEYKEILQKQITSIVSELEDLQEVARNKDNQLQIERSRVEELMRKGEILENSLREKESQLSMRQTLGDSQATGGTSEIVEVEPVVNKWAVQGTSVAPQVRSLRKVNNEQVSISINDVDSDNRDRLEDEDDDKAHGFKSLTTSRIVPRFTRPVTDLIDGLWVSCDRALMRQPALRLSVIIYWAVMHALLAMFVV